MVRKFDAKTILYNSFYDAKRMLDEGMSPKGVVAYLEKKFDFLKHPAPGNKISWD